MIFGRDKQNQDLARQLESYRSALHSVARHVGVMDQLAPPSYLSDAICRQFDAQSKGVRKEVVSGPGHEVREVSADVRKLKIIGSIEVSVRQGETPRLEVFSNRMADIKKLLTTVSGDCLVIETEASVDVSLAGGVYISGNGNTVVRSEIGSISIGRNYGVITGIDTKSSEPLGFRVELTLPNVSRLSVSGAAVAKYLDINQVEMSLDLSGAGRAVLAGKADRFEANVSGAGQIEAKELMARYGRFRLSGAGQISATANESVVARVSGVGVIDVFGDPKDRDSDVSGMGRIHFRNRSYE